MLIALEFNHTLQYVVRREQSIIQTKVVLLIALLAVARKFIILDLHTVWNGNRRFRARASSCTARAESSSECWSSPASSSSRNGARRATSAYDENGRELTDADLDECHGRVSRRMWDGKEVTMYHYVLTREYPYTVGCFRGTVMRVQMRGGQPQGGPQGGSQAGPHAGPQGGPPAGPHRPPAEAVDACAGSSSGARCRFTSPRGDAISGTCRAPGGTLACVPDMR